MNYNIFSKDTVIYEDGILEQVTISDLIELLESVYMDCSKFEDIVYQILNYTNYDKQDLCSLMNINRLSDLKKVIDILNSLD